MCSRSLGLLEHDRRVRVFDFEATLMRQPNDPGQQLHAVGILPLIVCVGKMNAEIAFSTAHRESHQSAHE